jgi:hypothetical protein
VAGPDRTYALQQNKQLLDHLVRNGEQIGRHSEPERLGGLEVDRELEPGRLRDRQADLNRGDVPNMPASSLGSYCSRSRVSVWHYPLWKRHWRAHEVALTDLDTAVAQNIVGGRVMKIEVR